MKLWKSHTRKQNELTALVEGGYDEAVEQQIYSFAQLWLDQHRCCAALFQGTALELVCCSHSST